MAQIYQVNSKKVVGQVIEGEAIIINFETGNYYSLNPTGSKIWSLIEQQAGYSQICSFLLDNYQAEVAQIETAARQFLAKLLQEELIVEVSAQTEPESPSANSINHSAKPPLIPPEVNTYNDMQDLLLLDPIHDVDETGWPDKKPL